MRTFDNPMETAFDLAPKPVDERMDVPLIVDGVPMLADASQTLTPVEYEKDEEDKETDAKIDKVYDAAMDAFTEQTSYIEVIEPRYAARNAEVAANFLSIALNAATAKGKMKNDRARSGAFIPFKQNNTTNNNVLVADRNQILRMMADGKTHEN